MNGRRLVRVMVQVVGAIVGVALFVWALRMAFTPDNQEAIRRLLDAPLWLAGAMILLNIGTVVVNGLIFWVAAKPISPIPAKSAVLTNAVCSLLAFLPFKLSAIARVYLHHKRDGMPLRSTIPWMVGYGLTAIAAFTPFILAAMLSPLIGAWWIVAGAIGAFACTGIGVLCARLADERAPALRKVSLGSWVIVRDAPTMFVGCALRLVDVGLQTGRFLVAAKAMGLALSVDRAALDATVYFLIGAISPGGVLGFREGGLAWLGELFGVDDKGAEQIALLALAVTGAEAATFCVLAIVAAFAMRLDKLIIRAAEKELEAEGSPPPTE
jgi:hypothetical protein